MARILSKHNFPTARELFKPQAQSLPGSI